MNRHVLIVNVYFAPRSFGGATIIAEQMAERLNREHDWQVSVFTTTQDPSLPAYILRRYRAGKVDIVAINIPVDITGVEQYFNPRVAKQFGNVLDSIQPDVVHTHSIQMMGADLLDEAVQRRVPLALTVHDCWWICERQFMVDRTGHYCFQRAISPDICRYCVDDIPAYKVRNEFLLAQLRKPDLLIFPSRFHQDLYLANGMEPGRCTVNKNGVVSPGPGYQRHQPEAGPVFGFLGGPGPIKGWTQILNALRQVNEPTLQLKVVDAAQNVGLTWQGVDYKTVPGDIKFVPAYTQDNLDAFFASIDILLFPSQWKESFGLSVREALLRDVWVIATNAGGPAEDLVNGVNATVIPLDGEHRHLAISIKQCYQRDGWGSYANPRKADITTMDEQATELSDTLAVLAADRR